MDNATTQTASPSKMEQLEKWMPGLRAMRNYHGPGLPVI